jgi:hypothetical protein
VVWYYPRDRAWPAGRECVARLRAHIRQQKVELVLTRRNQNQALGWGSVFQGQQSVDCSLVVWITTEAPHRLGGTCDHTTME